MSYLRRILDCRRHDLAGFLPFFVGDDAVGWVRPAFARQLRDWPAVFRVLADRVALEPGLGDFASRSDAVDEVLRALHERGVVAARRDEALPVLRDWGEEPLLRMDRGALSHFGVRGFGIHLNGIVRGPEGLEMWIARRSHRVHVAPGLLDHLVAGGQPYGLSLGENLAKECDEEASISADLAARALPTGAVSYRLETAEGLKNDTLFTYDLALPEEFQPVARDGEVEAFERWPIRRVMRTVHDDGDAFKFNVPPVLVHFFVRHGLLDPDHEEYETVVGALRA